MASCHPDFVTPRLAKRGDFGTVPRTRRNRLVRSIVRALRLCVAVAVATGSLAILTYLETLQRPAAGD